MFEEFSLGESDNYTLGDTDNFTLDNSFEVDNLELQDKDSDKIDIEDFYKNFVGAFVNSKYKENEYEDFILQGKIKAKLIYDFFKIKPFQKPSEAEKEKITELCNKLISEAEIFTRTDVEKRNILVNCIGTLKSIFTTGKSSIISERLKELTWNSLEITIDEKCEDGIVSMSEIVSLLKAGIKLGLVYDFESKRSFFNELKNKIDERNARIESFEVVFKEWFEEYASKNPEAYSTTLKNQLIIARKYKELEFLAGNNKNTSDKEYVLNFEENLSKLGIKLGEKTIKKKTKSQKSGKETEAETKNEIETETAEPDKIETVEKKKITPKKQITSDMIFVDEGSFMMGNDNTVLNEKPEHLVLLKSFYICNHEVTQSEYLSVMENNPSVFCSNPVEGELQENRPVEYVSWFDAIYYCNKKSIIEGLIPCYSIHGETNPGSWQYSPHKGNDFIDTVNCNFEANGYRLPTEAEWEYAAKGAGKSKKCKFAGSNDIDAVAWYSNNSEDKTHEVRKKSPNELGLFDMTGNVYEWCWDRYDYYSSSDTKNPHGALWASSRVLRGGSWHGNDYNGSVTNRNNDFPKNRFGYYGFRVVRSVK